MKTNWTIHQLERKSDDGFVLNVHWRYASDTFHSAYHQVGSPDFADKPTNYDWTYSLNNGMIYTNFGAGAMGLGISAVTNTAGRFEASNDIVAFSSSDIRLKNNITIIENPLEKVLKLGGYSFDWNDKQGTYTGKDYGIIAQEVEALFPEMVTTRDNGYKAVKYDRLIPVMIEAIKEQQTQINKLYQLLSTQRSS
jgi:hypothetical protein